MFSQRGHEAISVGIGLALEPEDVAAPMHRDLGLSLVRGLTPERIYGNLLGRQMGVTGGRDANLHGLGDLDLGLIGFISHLPHSVAVALGAAMAFRYRDEPRVAVTSVGDGGTTSGTFWESVNMAALWSAPLVVVIENNQYAYSTPVGEQMAVTDLAAKVAPHGVLTATVDGNDVEAVHEAVDAAIRTARTVGGPTVVEARTMRMLGHAIHDGAEYVPAGILEEWARRDPVDRLAQRLVDLGAATPEGIDRVRSDARDVAARAFAAAEAAPMPDPGTLTSGVYA